MSLIQLAERRWLPDAAIRFGIRRLLRDRLESERRSANGKSATTVDDFAERLRQSAITIETHRANEQHYEVPADFFEIVLGRRLKYSCGLWSDTVSSLDAAEEAMLRATCDRAQLENGMEVLDLGCGWGSLTLWIAEHFPACRITALSNSESQREFILQQCRERGYPNVELITSDIAAFAASRKYDRVISIEMLEHVRNYEQLFQRIAGWIKPQGLFFAHIFCHREFAYAFETDGANDWMGRHFFSGGIMPSEDLFRRFQRDLSLDRRWWIDGTHYSRTCDAWLRNLDANRQQALRILDVSLKPGEASLQLQRWRMFFMACSELFAYGGGDEWGIGHYLLRANGV